MISEQDRQHAIQLIREIFAKLGPVERRALLQSHLGPACPRVQFDGRVDDFARDVVDQLLDYGSVDQLLKSGAAGRRRHSLSILLGDHAPRRLRHSLDTLCKMPTAAERRMHLESLFEQVEKRLPRRLMETEISAGRFNAYGSVLDAFDSINRAVLFAPAGAGKSTALRQLAGGLALRALDNPDSPLPILADLSLWTGDESFASFVAAQAPHVGWALAYDEPFNGFVLLLDGFSEMPRDKAHGIFWSLPQSAVWLACSRDDYKSDLPYGIAPLELKPLVERTVHAAARASLTNAEQFISQLGEIPTQAANPFCLTLLFQVWESERGPLPRNLGELLARYCRGWDALAGFAWNESPGELTALSRTAITNAIGEERLRHAIDIGILEDAPVLRFGHQLFQEYFMAGALHEKTHQVSASDLWPQASWWQPSRWDRIARLTAESALEDRTPLIRWLAHAQPELTAQLLDRTTANPMLLAELQAAWQPRLLEGPVAARAAVGRALGRFGLDNRKGVGGNNNVPELDWVEIPDLKLCMSRYLITNAQYQAFLDAADGYRHDRWWAGLPDADRRPGTPQWSESNHPRENVSWYEAIAFCSWLSHQLEIEVRLPTIHEWERAMRGPHGRKYPWGDEDVQDYANVQFRIGRTTPVGIYTEGASEEGIHDLVGNLWEWCADEYPKIPGNRMLRGGSWNYRANLARGDYFNIEQYRHECLGFRVVAPSPVR